MWIPLPTRRPTPGEYAAIALVTSAGLIVSGVIALVVAFAAPAEKHATAVGLMQYAAWSLGSGPFLIFVVWLVRRLLQRA
jgi:hypothetical protein